MQFLAKAEISSVRAPKNWHLTRKRSWRQDYGAHWFPKQPGFGCRVHQSPAAPCKWSWAQGDSRSGKGSLLPTSIKAGLCWASETLWVEKFSFVSLNIWYIFFSCSFLTYKENCHWVFPALPMWWQSLIRGFFSIYAASYDWLLLIEVCRHLLCLLLLTVLNHLPIHTH